MLCRVAVIISTRFRCLALPTLLRVASSQPVPFLSKGASQLWYVCALQGSLMNKEAGKMADGEPPQDAQKLTFAEREANDLRELHLSATFLTPFAVAATQDNQVWLSNNQRDYKDHSKQQGGASNSSEMTPVVVKKKTDMAAMIGFQGRAAGRLATETREAHVFTSDFQDYVGSTNRTFFRTRDHFSDYAEAKARDPSRAKK